MSAYQELLAKREELNRQSALIDRQLRDAMREKRMSAIASIKELMSQHGLTVADLGAPAKRGPGVSKSAGTKVAPKYRNSETGQTWSGRGIKPLWLQSAISSGKSIEDFAV